MSRLGQILHRRRLDSELAGEIAVHIEEKADELVEAGMSREKALLAARAQFGNSTAVLEQSRAVWSFALVESLLRDLRISARGLLRAPLFTAVAAATLALGIGANAAIFSLINAVLLRPLPFPQSDRIVVLWERPPKTMSTASLGSRNQQNPVSPVNFLDWRERTRSFGGMAAISSFPMGLSGFGEPREVDALQVSAAFFRILGVAPLLGRAFDTSEDVPKGPHVAVLSFDLWQQQFGGDKSVIGRTVRLHDEPYTILGVMPQRFDLPFERAEIWVPIQIAPGMDSDEGRYLNVIAKLKPGVSVAQAQADLSAVARQISGERPYLSRDWDARAVSLYEQTTGEVSTALLLLFGAVTFVLLIAAGNVANLLLMRGTGRQREIALRAALGASRSRIAIQLLAESLLLSIAGGILGIGLAFAGLRALVVSLPALALPRIDGLQMDLRVLAFSAALCLGATFLFGLAPALAFSRTNPDEALKQGGFRGTSRGHRRVRGLLVVAEVAVSLVLLVGAGLLGRSFFNQTSVSRGFRTDHILTMRMFFAPARYYDDRRRARYLDQILARVRALPSVKAASSAHFLPLVGVVSGSGFHRLDRPEPAPGTGPGADFLIVSPQYFVTMGIPLLGGRDFDEHDTVSSEPGIVVNQTFVQRFFRGEDPIGKRLGLDWNVRHGVIIGVTADTRQTDLKVDPQPTIFLNQAQTPMYFGALVVRSALPPATVASAVEQAVHAVDPDQAISHVESMEQVLSASVARPRLESILLGIFAGVALLLAAIGLYGVLAYSVSQRTREIGIRMALGANPAQLARGIVRDGLGLMLAGIIGGLAASFALTRLLRSLLYHISPADPLTIAAVCALLLVVGLFASWLPARRAAAVDPVGSLRME
ncbi:MAG: ABC transporter permease [Bryobacteraceae bacterium]|jgi:putative ABC transport system permease protein